MVFRLSDTFLKKLRLLTLLLLVVTGTAGAQVPVILRVSAAEQQDTTGCNFVKELCRITYDAIINGNVKLWDTKDKEIRIFPASLQEIERSTETLFQEEDVVFIYEYWTVTSKDVRSTTTGLFFSGKGKGGQEVAYGYIDYEDLQPFMMRERIRSNVNGNYSANLATYFYNKSFNYNILQFAGNVVDNVTKSAEIKEKFIADRKFNTSEFSSVDIRQKMVRWSVDTSSVLNPEKAQSGKQLMRAVQDFLKQNEEVFLNLGGDAIVAKLKKKDAWKVSRLEVEEIWKKTPDGISYDPVGVHVFVNDSALAEIPYREMVKFDISIDLKNWVDYIREKPFQYTIQRINSEEIPRRDAFKYLKGLQTYDWNKLTDFIRYY